ncbi:hypothetical protein DB347_07055 [Opitutaceae bacterium EW11]|nr:hypothetical protein DB347_07055 [Opitutaceae bacterium EW11]
MDAVPSADRPRISSNQLGEFVFATPAERARILRDQKRGNTFRSPYYQSASNAVLRAFNGGRYDVSALRSTADELKAREAKHRNQATKFDNNAEMLRRFASIASLACPPAGEHTVVRRDALIELDGVLVSVRPEITTVRQNDAAFSYTKFRYSKSKVSEDSSEIILLILLKFGRAQASEHLNFDVESTKLVDCFARSVIQGHRLGGSREKQLSSALGEIRRLWPTIA